MESWHAHRACANRKRKLSEASNNRRAVEFPGLVLKNLTAFIVSDQTWSELWNWTRGGERDMSYDYESLRVSDILGFGRG